MHIYAYLLSVFVFIAYIIENRYIPLEAHKKKSFKIEIINIKAFREISQLIECTEYIYRERLNYTYTC